MLITLAPSRNWKKKIGMPHIIEVLWTRIFDAFVGDTQAYQEWSVSKLLNANIIHRLVINKSHQNK